MSGSLLLLAVIFLLNLTSAQINPWTRSGVKTVEELCDVTDKVVKCEYANFAGIGIGVKLSIPRTIQKVEILHGVGVHALLDDGILRNLPLLREVSLTEGTIESPPSNVSSWFVGSPDVRSLNLSGNQISELVPRSFSGMHELEVLVLSNNDLKTIDPGVLDDLTSLRLLSLTNNKLEYKLGLKLFDKIPATLKSILITVPEEGTVPGEVFRYLDQEVTVSDPDREGPLLLEFLSNKDQFDLDCITGECYESCGEPKFLNEINEPGPPMPGAYKPQHMYSIYTDLHDVKLDSVQRLHIWSQFVTTRTVVHIPRNVELRIFTKEFYMEQNYLYFGRVEETPCKVLLLTTGSGQVWYLLKQGNVVIIAQRLHYPTVCELIPDPSIDKSFLKKNIDDLFLQYVRAITYCAKMLSENHGTDKEYKQAVEMLDWVLTILSWPEPGQVQSFFTQAVAVKGDVESLQTGSRYVPNLSQVAYSRLLDLQHRLAMSYSNEYDQYLETKNSREFRATLFEVMRVEADGLSSSTVEDLEQAKGALETARRGVAKLKKHFDETKPKVDEALKTFQIGIKLYGSHEVSRTIFGVIKAIKGVASGDFTKVTQGMEGLWNTFERTVRMIRTLHRIINANAKILEKIQGQHMTVEREMEYLKDLDMASDLAVNIVEWRNMVTHVKIMLLEGDAAHIIGSRGYRRRIEEMAEWGEALTRETIRQTDLMRRYLAKEAAMIARKTYNERVNEVMADAKQTKQISKEMRRTLSLQMVDVKWMLTDTIHLYCQTYFYYHFKECPSTQSPKLQDDLKTLLRKIDRIKINGLNQLSNSRFVPQTMEIGVSITDKENCTECPIANFRETNSLIYKIDRQYGPLRFMDRVRVAELTVDFVGLRMESSSDYVHVSIKTAGAFQDSYRNQVYNFTSDPLRRGFVYNPTTKNIQMRAQVEEKTSDVYQEISPFTTWILELDKAINPPMDLSAVTEVKLVLRGSAVSRYSGFRRRTFRTMIRIRSDDTKVQAFF